MALTSIEVPLIGTDGNVFGLIGKVDMALKRGGEKDLAKEFTEKAFACDSYDHVLQLIMEYVDIGTAPGYGDEDDEDEDDF